MTDAERQRRRRQKLRKEKLRLGAKAERQRRQLKAAKTYIPMPPGITYWMKVTVQTAEGEREIWAPKTRPLAALPWGELEDSDLHALRERLDREIEGRRRGRRGTGGGGVMVWEDDREHPREE